MNKAAWDMYNEVYEGVRFDLVEAAMWARDTLMRHEGAGHDFHISANRDRMLCCSFAKPQWSGDHHGPYMESASEAIVAAVCGYLNGC